MPDVPSNSSEILNHLAAEADRVARRSREDAAAIARAGGMGALESAETRTGQPPDAQGPRGSTLSDSAHRLARAAEAVARLAREAAARRPAGPPLPSATD